MVDGLEDVVEIQGVQGDVDVVGEEIPDLLVPVQVLYPLFILCVVLPVKGLEVLVSEVKIPKLSVV